MAQKSAKSTARRTAKKAPTPQKTSPKKSPVKRRPTLSVRSPRSLKAAPNKRFRLHKPIRHPVKLPSVWRLTKATTVVLWQNRVLFLVIIAWYALLSVIFVQNVSGTTNVANLKSTLEHIATGNLGAVASSLGVFAVLVGSTANTASPIAGFYQLVFGLITSLAIIWALRQRASGTKIRIRDTYYRGMYPLIPFILVLLVICVQLIPFVIGTRLYITVVSGGIAAHFIEKAFWLLLFLALAFWSLYMITATVFALYIVTLPDMTPIKSMRAAKKLVRHRRLIVLRKLICMPIILLLIAAVIMLPIILIAVSLAPWVLLLLSFAAIAAVHAYMYTLYRELLNE
jgi:hypothetical protein